MHEALYDPGSCDGDGEAFDMVTIAASEGGLAACTQLLSALPPEFPAAITIVQHRSSAYASTMCHHLGRRTRLQVKDAEDGEPLCAGTVYLAPVGKHFLVGPDRTVRIDSSSPPVNFFRPAADLLFSSVAATYEERAIAVVLTGNRNDGARGVQAIKRAGGRVLVQDQATSERFAMPSAALSTGCVDFVLPLDRIASALVALTMVRGAATLFRVPVPPWAQLPM
ncbi:chemotaxis protein CheB [Sorangium sp. So ce134]